MTSMAAKSYFAMRGSQAEANARGFRSVCLKMIILINLKQADRQAGRNIMSAPLLKANEMNELEG